MHRATVQRCMMAISHVMSEKNDEVLMSDFRSLGIHSEIASLVRQDSFKGVKTPISVLNLEIVIHVKEGIVLGHKISKNGIEVDKAKVEVIAKLPHPTTVKGVRSFPSSCYFKTLKKKLLKLPNLIAPDWEFNGTWPIELKCDASDLP
ncbi:hypothetical protein Tco_1256027 [Tanacetum coccineum]